VVKGGTPSETSSEFRQTGKTAAVRSQVHDRTCLHVGDTINVQWRATADFLLEPYLGADAYVTKDGLMFAQVTTFRSDEIKMKK
jgi:hypothetical protein